MQQLAASASSLLKALPPISVRPRRLFRATPSYGDDKNECCRYYDHTPSVHNHFSAEHAVHTSHIDTYGAPCCEGVVASLPAFAVSFFRR